MVYQDKDPANHDFLNPPHFEPWNHNVRTPTRWTGHPRVRSKLWAFLSVRGSDMCKIGRMVRGQRS